MQNRNNEEFDFDDSLEEATSPTRLEPDAHPDIPDDLLGVELEQEQITDALDIVDPDIDPAVMA